MTETRIDRRSFLRGSAGALATASLGLAGCSERPGPYSPDDGWDAGQVVHLLPGANHERLLLKASFREPQPKPPTLAIDGRSVRGRRGDSQGLFHAFDVRGLEPDTSYELRLRDASGTPLCDPWPLRTLPHPGATRERVRILCYTCAGGPELYNPITGDDYFQPLAIRRRLLARGLAFGPDLAIANGDHVYWDQRGRLGRLLGDGPLGWWLAGSFDREAPLSAGQNESVLRAVGDSQIAALYGTLFRSVPVSFLQDDHDYLENDEASEELRTFPPDAFMLGAARATQRLYYPEGFSDPALPAAHREGGLARSYSSLRYGKLFEALLYDCRGGLGNPADPQTPDAFAGFVPPDIEAWLLARTRASNADHLVHMPSTPVLWTAGKWGEWYPDIHDEEQVLRSDAPNPYWPAGWKAQHDRLLVAASARRDRIPLFVSGDLHSTAIGQILETGDSSLAQNPVVSLLCGTPGTSGPGWPSRFRGQRAMPSGSLRAEEWTPPIEENGFSLLDVTELEIEVSMFRWKPEDGLEAIARLEPFEVRSLPRPT
jgi:hypothetical protein